MSSLRQVRNEWCSPNRKASQSRQVLQFCRNEPLAKEYDSYADQYPFDLDPLKSYLDQIDPVLETQDLEEKHLNSTVSIRKDFAFLEPHLADYVNFIQTLRLDPGLRKQLNRLITDPEYIGSKELWKRASGYVLFIETIRKYMNGNLAKVAHENPIVKPSQLRPYSAPNPVLEQDLEFLRFFITSEQKLKAELKQKWNHRNLPKLYECETNPCTDESYQSQVTENMERVRQLNRQDPRIAFGAIDDALADLT